MAYRMQVDYSQLETVAQMLQHEANETERTLRTLRRDLEMLRRGGWQGRAANAFTAEIEQNVIPNVERMIRTLETSERQIRTLIVLMEEGEERIAVHWLKLKQELRLFSI